MPLITIKSLPFERTLDFSVITANVARDVAESVGQNLGCLNVVWEFIPKGQHAAAGRTVPHQPETTFPVIVQLLGSASYSTALIEKYYRAIASSIHANTGVSKTNIFIYFSSVEGGRIHEGGL